jgi:two-component system, cell cycle response regulator DivK
METAGATKPTSDNSMSNPKTVLIIEDDDASQYVFGTMLEHAGYRVLHARNARSGLKLVETDAPDLMILDLGLPEVDGYSLLEQIRGRPETKALPVLVVTVHVFPQDEKRAYEAGCDHFMKKPVEPSALAQQVTAMIGPAHV